MNFKIKNKKEYPLICFYSHCEPKKRANAIFLICAWQVLYLNCTPEEAYNGFRDDLTSLNSSESLKESTNMSLPPKRRIKEFATESRDISNLNRFYQVEQELPLPPFHDASPGECTYAYEYFEQVEVSQPSD